LQKRNLLALYNNVKFCIQVYQTVACIWFNIFLSARQSVVSHVTPDNVKLGGELLLFRLTAKAWVSSASHFAVSSNFLGWKQSISITLI
jgi:hypothetical protein